MKVKAISFAGYEDVYNMEVDDTHNFAVENGVIVHNCADEVRYMCMEKPMEPKKILPQEIKPFNPLESPEKVGRYNWYKMNF